jgi:hypothetical protein
VPIAGVDGAVTQLCFFMAQEADGVSARWRVQDDGGGGDFVCSLEENQEESGPIKGVAA